MLIHLVRHAMPQVRTDLAPDAWALSAEGARAARELRGALPSDATVVSSPERKAIETVRLATARDPMVCAQFAEVDRPGEPFDGDPRPRQRAWVQGWLDERHQGWESPGAAAARFAAGIATAPAVPHLVVGTHGMVLTAWLVSIGRLPAGVVAGDWWGQLTLPAVVRVER